MRDRAVPLLTPMRARAVPLLTPMRARAVRDGLRVGGLGAFLLVWATEAYGTYPFGADSQGYFQISLDNIYHAATGNLDALLAFRYAPPIALALVPAHLLTWEQFRILWVGVELLALVWLCRGWSLAVIGVPYVAWELWAGNINLVMAAAIVIGFRFPVAWSLILLTKVTPGICLLWFAVRREWRSLAVALAATALLAGASWLVRPGLWGGWVTMLTTDAGLSTSQVHIAVPLGMRLPLAALITIWGALSDRRWAVPVAATVALPVIWLNGLSLLVACVPLLQEKLVPSVRTTRIREAARPS